MPDLRANTNLAVKGGPEVLEKDGACKTEQQTSDGGVPERGVQAEVRAPATRFLNGGTIQDWLSGSRFLEEKQLAKREIVGKSLAIHGIRGLAEDIRGGIPQATA